MDDDLRKIRRLGGAKESKGRIVCAIPFTVHRSPFFSLRLPHFSTAEELVQQSSIPALLCIYSIPPNQHFENHCCSQTALSLQLPTARAFKTLMHIFCSDGENVLPHLLVHSFMQVPTPISELLNKSWNRRLPSWNGFLQELQPFTENENTHPQS